MTFYRMNRIQKQTNKKTNSYKLKVTKIKKSTLMKHKPANLYNV